MNQKYKIIFFVVGGSLVLFAVANFPYLWKNFRYHTSGPEIASPDSSSFSEKVEPNTLWLPSLNIQAPIKYVEEASDDAFQEALRAGVVHFPGTALPGQFGNVYIFGHSSDNLWAKGDYKTVFAFLPNIKLDERIDISDAEGNKFVYKVIETRIISPKDTQFLDQGNYKKKRLTLQTSYPLGTALESFIVIAKLVE